METFCSDEQIFRIERPGDGVTLLSLFPGVAAPRPGDVVITSSGSFHVEGVVQGQFGPQLRLLPEGRR